MLFWCLLDLCSAFTSIQIFLCNFLYISFDSFLLVLWVLLVMLARQTYKYKNIYGQKVPILHDFHGFLYLCLTAWVHGIFSWIISKLTTSFFMAIDIRDREENPTKNNVGKMYFSNIFSTSFLSFRLIMNVAL